MVAALPLFIGDTWTIPVQIGSLEPDAPIGTLPTPTDLTGATVSARFWRTSDLLPFRTYSEDDGSIVVAVPATGKATIRVPEEDTATIADLPVRAGSYPTRLQVRVTWANGDTTTATLIYVDPLDPRTVVL